MMIKKFSTYFKYLLFLVSVLIFWLSRWQVHQAYYHSTKTRHAKTHLLILTTWRSGSTFVGHLFNHNLDVFYMMEPDKHIWNRLPQEHPNLLHTPLRDLIRSIFLCDMSAFSYYISNNEFISNIFMWQESRALCSPPICPDSTFTQFNRTECLRKCNRVPFEKLEEACRAHSYVVVKVVRILDLKILYQLLKDPSLDLKIIHLVRDPRAILSSREGFPYLNEDDATISRVQNSKNNISVVMQEICNAQVQMYKLASQDPQPFLKGRYRMMRYEDLVRDPVAHIRDLYDFVGLKITPSMESWIYNVTHGLIPNDKDLLPFSEDSRKIALQWRERLSFQKVKEVQKLCQQDMEVFGYAFIEAEQEQKNMSLDLLLPKLDQFNLTT
ncbi:carbohydrate sulfotransferase 5-like [Rhinatrema bivittatum]|uniref:carbohydrate sulfotransferase 5-like n=1 Tax=Rhinatrema bivittatum TaxID=194408 RepID=UPI00112AC19B|nr:carbohydrate sulfotransferase 5-like [Rhinatrema bivittatum]